jgi:hypothetical protein
MSSIMEVFRLFLKIHGSVCCAREDPKASHDAQYCNGYDADSEEAPSPLLWPRWENGAKTGKRKDAQHEATKKGTKGKIWKQKNQLKQIKAAVD